MDFGKIHFDKILSEWKDYHLPIFVGMFGVGCVLQWFHHMDMAFVAFTGTVIGGITGHAFSPAQAAPDPTVSVNVNNANTNTAAPAAPAPDPAAAAPDPSKG